MIKCPVCPDTRQTKELLESHVELQHRGEVQNTSLVGRRLSCICDGCGSEFNRSAGQITDSQYCNASCYDNRGCRKSLGVDVYGRYWEKQRARALERDGYECQLCRGEEQSPVMDVHHKNPVRPVEKWDSIEEAHELSNLVTLCRTCHKTIENMTESVLH